jgi:single-stranded-DNA-specific exonuclease
VYQIHEGKQHGIVLDKIPTDIGLVICPDSASNDYEQHEELAKRNIFTLVLDHHEAPSLSEYACVINNQMCDYPTKSLSGVGIVYKFCQYLDSLLEVNYANEFLDLVSLGITADVMDLRAFETRHLVSKGLEQINNPFFSAMVDKQSFVLGEHITSFGVAFYIAPLINATVRVGTQNEKLVLFESMLEHKAYEDIPSTKRGCSGQVEMRVIQACRNCTNIKNRQTKARDASLDVIERLIENQNLLENKILIIKLSKLYAVEKNLTGLIANELMGKYKRPVLLLNEIQNENTITWEGSARNYDKSEFKTFKDFIEESGLALYAAGHQGAFGVGFTQEALEDFISYSNEKLKDFEFSPSYLVDYIWNANNYNTQDILDIASLNSLWGQGISEPYIVIENLTITKNNIKLGSPDKNPTLIIDLPNGTSLVKFRSNAQEYENLYSELGCVKINIVGKCAINSWNGTINPQIKIEEYSILERQEYYF